MTSHQPSPTLNVDDVSARVSAIACRQIVADDEQAVVKLLSTGFSTRSIAYWQRAFATLRDRPVPEGCPRFGYCLTADGDIIGLILLIYSTLPQDQDALRCNVSSWYVLPRFRIYASVLVNMALRNKRGTYFNCSSIATTRQTIALQGFSCYAQGQFIAFAAAGRPVRDVVIQRIRGDMAREDNPDNELLSDHARHGCMALLCTLKGESYPFVFIKRHVPSFKLPYAQLIYCRDIDSFVRLQGPIGRYLMARGMPLVMLDANAPIKGLIGHYFKGRGPKYFRGEHPPRHGDLAYSELVFFGP